MAAVAVNFDTAGVVAAAAAASLGRRRASMLSASPPTTRAPYFRAQRQTRNGRYFALDSRAALLAVTERGISDSAADALLDGPASYDCSLDRTGLYAPDAREGWKRLFARCGAVSAAGVPSSFCSIPAPTDERAADARWIVLNQEHLRMNGLCAVCGSPHHRSKVCTARRCARCGRAGGHPASEAAAPAVCPMETLACERCGRCGHLVDECPDAAVEASVFESAAFPLAVCIICGARGHRNCQSQPRPLKVFLSCCRCGQAGHTFSTCKRRALRPAEFELPPASRRGNDKRHKKKRRKTVE